MRSMRVTGQRFAHVAQRARQHREERRRIARSAHDHREAAGTGLLGRPVHQRRGLLLEVRDFDIRHHADDLAP